MDVNKILVGNEACFSQDTRKIFDSCLLPNSESEIWFHNVLSIRNNL